jgi:hypothetical protein
MGSKVALLVVSVAVGIGGFFAATAVVSGATSHQDPCHSRHECPSDHHTYIWLDPRTALWWDCARPGATEYDPTRDTTTIVWDGLTYYCRAAGGTTTTTTTTTTSSSTTTTTTDTAATTTTAPTSTTTTRATVPITTTPPVPEFVLPDRERTPGAFNPSVRQTTIRKTICVRGWTKKIRPPVSYTNTLKLKQMTQYSETGQPSAYEEDHLIPLELGGAPRNPNNLWPEPRAESKKSDPVETNLKRLVCARKITLAKGRAEIRAFKFANG